MYQVKSIFKYIWVLSTNGERYLNSPSVQHQIQPIINQKSPLDYFFLRVIHCYLCLIVERTIHQSIKLWSVSHVHVMKLESSRIRSATKLMAKQIVGWLICLRREEGNLDISVLISNGRVVQLSSPWCGMEMLQKTIQRVSSSSIRMGRLLILIWPSW